VLNNATHVYNNIEVAPKIAQNSDAELNIHDDEKPVVIFQSFVHLTFGKITDVSSDVEFFLVKAL